MELVTLTVASSPMEADMLKAMLESYGLQVMLQSHLVTHTMIRNVNVGPLGEIRLLVREDQAEEALAILQSAEQDEFVDELEE